jgi:hypothetical protein
LQNSILCFLTRKIDVGEATLTHVLGLSPLCSPSCPIGRFCEERKLKQITLGQFYNNYW